MDERITRTEAMALLKRGATWMAAHADEIGCEREGKNVFFRRADIEAWRNRGYSRTSAAPARQAAPAKRMIRLPDGINKLTGLPRNRRAS